MADSLVNFLRTKCNCFIFLASISSKHLVTSCVHRYVFHFHPIDDQGRENRDGTPQPPRSDVYEACRNAFVTFETGLMLFFSMAASRSATLTPSYEYHLPGWWYVTIVAGFATSTFQYCSQKALTFQRHRVREQVLARAFPLRLRDQFWSDLVVKQMRLEQDGKNEIIWHPARG